MTSVENPAARTFNRRSSQDRRAAHHLATRKSAHDHAAGVDAPHITVDGSYVTIALTMMLLFINVTNVIAQYGTLYHNHGEAHELIRLFNVSNEANIPSWFNSTLLLFNALLLGMIMLARRNAAHSFAGYWGVLAAGFFYLSVDESSSLHENLNEPMVELTRSMGFSSGGMLTFAWPIAALAILAIFVWRFVPFMRHLPKRICVSFLISGAIFVSGAVVMEIVGGYMFDTHGYYSKGFVVASTIEEFLEMTGLIVFADALMRYIRQHVGEVTLNAR